MMQRGFPDRNQNFWQLASIQSASMGLPGFVIGGQLAKQYGAGTAALSMCIGNLIIWIIGLAIVSMAAEERKNAIENVKRALGKPSAAIAALVVMAACLIWYLLQIHAVTVALDTLLKVDNHWREHITLRYGAALGILTALLSIGGIRLIKWLSVCFLPILFCYSIYGMATSTHPTLFKGTWGVSLYAVAASILFFLPGMINMPTFFRHSRSKADSYLGLALMTIFISFFQIASILMGFDVFSEIFSRSDSSFQLVLTVAFIILILMCSNLVNIYFASASWEGIFPRFGGPKEYAIIGLGGTVAYTFIQVSPPMLFLEDLMVCFIASLGVVLIVDFLTKIIIKHRSRKFERLISGVSWLAGCVTVVILEIQHYQEVSILLIGMGASLLFFLCLIFIEEAMWAIKKLLDMRKLGQI